MTKVYSTKSNAIRAAKGQGLGTDAVYATEGGFTFNAPIPLATTESTSGNPAGWETAGGPTDQEAGPVVTLVEDPARHVVVGEPSNPAPAGSVPYAMAEGTNSAGEPARGPASDSGTPLSDLVDEPPVVLLAKPAKGADVAGPAKGNGKGKGKAAKPAKPAKAAKAAKGKPGRKPKAPAEPKAPRDTKLSRFVAMLRRPEGCTLDDAMDAFGWQRHTARGAIAGAIKVKLGLTVETEKVEGKTVYRIPA